MKHFVSASCEGETGFCGAPARHKVGEEIPHDEPCNACGSTWRQRGVTGRPDNATNCVAMYHTAYGAASQRHNLTAYVCCTHFVQLFGGAAPCEHAIDVRGTMNCKCGNEARYINAQHELCCSVCPIKGGLDAIRLTDVPTLHQWCVTYLEARPKPKSYRTELRTIVDKVAPSYIATLQRAIAELNWARKYLNEHPAEKPHRSELRTLIGRIPEMPLYHRKQLERVEQTIPAAPPLPFPALSDEQREHAEAATAAYQAFADAAKKDPP